MTFEEDVRKYEVELQPKYENFTNKLETLLKDFLTHEKIKFTIQSRTKSVRSFQKKINRPDKKYEFPLNEVTDFTGIRIIVSSLKDVELVKRLIEKEFMIDKERSIDKSEILKTNQFGYLSKHIIVKINESRYDLPEWSSMKDLWAEIQVRTVLQHAWADVSHFLEYKNKIDVPKKFKRKLYRLSAVFELADDNLDGLISDINDLSVQYKEEINSKKLKIEINANSLSTYLENSENMSYWMNELMDKGFNIKHRNDPSVLIKLMKNANINNIEKLDDLLENSIQKIDDIINKELILIWNDTPVTPNVLYDDELVSSIINYNLPDSLKKNK